MGFSKRQPKLVGCHSKLLSHPDSLKSIHFKETFALISAFKHFRPYLLNTKNSVTVFTDARSLIWVGRNREYSIACNGLANKLAQIQLEIPHTVYSVPSETNYLADIFSRAFSTSRFLDKSKFALSKNQAANIPPITDPFFADENALYQFFSQPLQPENADQFPRNKPKIATPKPIKNLYKLFETCTPEEKYFSALRLLQGWNDKTISKRTASLNSASYNFHTDDDTFRYVKDNHKALFQRHCDEFIKKTMKDIYNTADPIMKKRLQNTLSENLKKNASRIFQTIFPRT